MKCGNQAEINSPTRWAIRDADSAQSSRWTQPRPEAGRHSQAAASNDGDQQPDADDGGHDVPHDAHRLEAKQAENRSFLGHQHARGDQKGGDNERESHYEVAHQTVFHDSRYPSHLILPVVEA